jgi:hypothetical protein
LDWNVNVNGWDWIGWDGIGNGIGRRGEGSGRKEERIGLFECWELEIGGRMKRERKKKR